MNSRGNHHIWRTFGGRRWRLAQFLIDTGESLRNANKPADLTFTIDRTLDLVVKTREYQYEWLEKQLKMNPEDRGRWPRL